MCLFLGGFNMIRAFAILWLAVFVPTTLLIIPSGVNPVLKLNEQFSEDFYKPIYRVNFEVLSNKLLQQPTTQWQQTIDHYAKSFAYPVKLQPLADYQADNTIYASLQQGQVTFLYADPMALLQRVGDSDQVLYIALNESTEHAVLNQAKGTLSLAIEDLRQLPKSEWKNTLAQTNAKLPVHISLTNETQLSETAKLALLNSPDEIVSYINDEGRVELLAPIDDGLWLHVQDNLSQAVQLKLSTTIALMFFLLISLALILWVYPLWRDLTRLVATATEFGQGKLSQRARASKLSVVSQLSDSFNNMADNIESLIARQRELTNAVAHDLRTPLYRLRFAIEMLEDPHTSDAQKEKYQRALHTSIDDLDHLINQNLLLSRYNRIADITHFSPCCFARELLNEIDDFKLQHPELDIQFYCSPELKQHRMFIDNKGLMRAVKNLLTNASRFAQSTIIVSFKYSGSAFHITVEDDGQGVPNEHAERIFEPFTQLDNQARSSEKGHGLGLAIVKQIMLWHKGNAKVVSSTLGGAAFELQWPELYPNTAESEL
ncbi:two-component sensor histidine kinase [Vibrio vulnificus]|nr:two-component sensor histidine kinase [Vibrio vulnificus]RZR14762.1 two-component sensor histidine kinase [Vibrio vulnificus]HDY7773330.1 ATP-binding protein [Vibrio vulnificus]